MFRRWDSESVIAVSSLLALVVAACLSKSEATTGALISVATYCVQKYWEIKKLKMSVESEKSDASEKM
jgi:type III secretory pathway component EscU